MKAIAFLCAVCATAPMLTFNPAYADKLPSSNDVPAADIPVYEEVLVGDAAKEYAQKTGIVNYEAVEEVYISDNVQKIDADISPCYLGNDYYIKSGTISTTYEYGDMIRRSEYQGPATATMSVTETISATFSFDFTIGADELNASLGYSTTSSFAISDSYTIEITDDSFYAIECYTNIEKKTFEVWEDDLFFDDYVGVYYSTRPIGCIFFKIKL